MERRQDGLGANHNARLFAGVRALGGSSLAPGSVGASVVPELGPEPTDLVLGRYHGIGPMGGTDLDPVLRNLGVTTIVATGVSVNVAILSLVMDAVNSGYNVILPRDAVAGVPRAYTETVIENTLALLATITTTDALIDVWS
jgi:nicotinamidase-related amidase